MSRGEHTEAKARAGHRLPDAADEIALIGQVAGGDMTAFETLFRRYYPRLRRFLERMTRRPQLVDEILNDTMLVVWRKADTFNLRSKLSTWIIGIALRRSLKALERVDDAIDFDPDAAGLLPQDFERLGRHDQRDRAAVPDVLGVRARVALQQRPDVLADRWMIPHTTVHRPDDQQGALRRQDHGGEQVVRKPMREFGEAMRGSGSDHDQVRSFSYFQMRHSTQPMLVVSHLQPIGRNRPSGFGMYTRLTGWGR